MPAVKLSPVFNSQVVDENGKPAVGWKIQTYVAGSSTPLATYTDSTGNFPQSNPIILNSLGFPTNGQLWLASGRTYKLVLTDSNDAIKKTEDNVSGINDTSTTVDEWADTSLAPTYISASSFSLQGDQTSIFHIGRRLKFQTTAGTVYGLIKTSVFTSVTTVTVQMDGAQTLDPGLSVVQVSILRANVLSLPVRRGTTTGVVNVYAASVGILRVVPGEEYEVNFALVNDGAAPPTLNLDSTGALAILLKNGSVPSPGALNGEHTIRASDAGYVVMDPNVIPQVSGLKRQCAQFGPVDTNNFFTPGGVTGATSVATTAISALSPLVVNAAGGINLRGQAQDRIGFSTANLTWTGLTTNGQMYLFVDVAASGALTPVSSALQTIYQRGGAFSTVNNQHSVNTELMGQAIGNGTSATQSYRVPLGEVTVAGGVVTAIIWYRLNRKYVSAPITNPNTAGSSTTVNHQLGIPFSVMKLPYVLGTNPTALDSWIAGVGYQVFSGNSLNQNPIFVTSRNAATLQAGSTSPGFFYQNTTGSTVAVPATATFNVLLEGDF